MKFIPMRQIIFLCTALAVISFSSCKKEKDYTAPVLTHLPIADGNYSHVVPLGQLNPPAHTLPTGHMYFYMNDHMVVYDVYCPGELYLTAVSKSINGYGTPNEFTEYGLEFGSQSTGLLRFGHIQTLTAEILAEVGDFPESGCSEYTTGGNTFKYCKKTGLDIAMTAGQKMGTVGGQPTIYAFDMGISDASGKEIQIQPFLSEDLLNLMKPKIGNGTQIRTTEPVCGEINVDVLGTAKGNWFFPGEDHTREDKHLALSQDNVDPAVPKISVGISLTDQPSGVFGFDVQNTGIVNREFVDITPDGNTYCYNLKQGAVPTNTSIIVKLTNSTTLQVERRNCDCTCNTPYVFSSNSVTYNR